MLEDSTMRILYLDVDSLRPDHLGCYGYDRDTSPTIDRIAADGRRFTNYYASDVPCLPSRTAFFASRFGIHTRVVNHGGTYADVQPRGPSRGMNTDGPYRSWVSVLTAEGYETAFISPFPRRHGAWHTIEGFAGWRDTGGNGDESADVVFDEAETWLREHADEEDWYLHVNFWDPHTHYDTPRSYGDPFSDDPAPAWPDEETIAEQYERYGPHGARDLHHWYVTGEDPRDLERVPDEIASRGDFVRWINGYDTGIRYMDDYVERLLELLDAAGVLEETTIVVSADHGENQGELNVYGDHQTADEMTCNVPLIVRGPGIEPGIDDAFYYQVDLGPTLLDLAGVTADTRWDGRSFVDSLVDGTAVGRDYLVCSQGAWSAQRSVRWEDWLLVRTYHDGFHDYPPVMLYDLDADPHETTNLARERSDIAEKGLALLQNWREQRMTEQATGVAGGNPERHGGTADPLWEMLHEGGPFHSTRNLDAYVERLRETDRDDVAAVLRRRRGVVDESAMAYLNGT